MQARESPLRPLLEGTRQYQIPLYQRRYAWTRTEWEALWKAIRHQYKNLIDAAESAPSHFLGSFVLAPVPGMAASPAKHRVVDGQQRLATIMLTLAATRDLLAEVSAEERTRFDELYLLNKWQQGDDRFKLLPSTSDQAALFAILTGEGSPSASSSITAAYRYMKNEMRKGSLGEEQLDLYFIESAIVDRLWIVEISTGDADNVHRIFQTLNSNGVDLDQVDLLRNHFFMLLPTMGDEAYAKDWRLLEDELGLRELDYFLWIDLICSGDVEATLPRTGVYAAWQARLEQIENDEGLVRNELKRLHERGLIYRRIVDPSLETEPEIRRWLYRSAEWSSTVHHPVLFRLLLDYSSGRLSESETVESFKLVESYLVRRLIAKIPTNNLNRIFTAVASSLADGGSSPARLSDLLAAPGNYWPTDAEVRARARTEEFYRAQRPPQRQFVLRRLEEYFSPVEQVNWESCQFTIEHIMPQTMTEEWFSYLEGVGDDPIKTYSELVHTIGNTTLTCFNPSLSNKPIERKQEILANSSLRMNQELAIEPVWSREAILRRSDLLAEAAIAIWPGPPSQDGPTAGEDPFAKVAAALAALPSGKWTTYSALAELSGLPVTEVMSHLRRRGDLQGVHRVARSDGVMDLQAPWASQDVESYMQRLAGEGILSETPEGPRLLDAGRLDAEDLSNLLGEG